jgi:hypothetical protein
LVIDQSKFIFADVDFGGFPKAPVEVMRQHFVCLRICLNFPPLPRTQSENSWKRRKYSWKFQLQRFCLADHHDTFSGKYNHVFPIIVRDKKQFTIGTAMAEKNIPFPREKNPRTLRGIDLRNLIRKK